MNKEKKSEAKLSASLNFTGSHNYRIGAFSKSCKPENEDSYGVFLGKNVNCIAIADGVGESIDASVGSRIATNTFITEVKKLDLKNRKISTKVINRAWGKVGRAIAEAYQQAYDKNQGEFTSSKILSSSFFATTLLVALELKDSYIFTYLGNGSIWFIRGDFWKFTKSRREWPWCLTNLVIPHTVLGEGEELFGIIDNKGVRGEPYTLQMGKDNNKGEIILMTTDGISSQDKLEIGFSGKNGENKQRWLKINPYILDILNAVKNHLDKLKQETIEEKPSLEDIIKNYLDSQSFDDDATLGLIISERAIKYYKDNLEENS